jgi:hypothetical protein
MISSTVRKCSRKHNAFYFRLRMMHALLQWRHADLGALFRRRHADSRRRKLPVLQSLSALASRPVEERLIAPFSLDNLRGRLLVYVQLFARMLSSSIGSIWLKPPRCS